MSIFQPKPTPKRSRGRPRKNPLPAPGALPGLVGRPRVKPFGPELPPVRKPREPGVARPRVVPVRLSDDEHEAFKRTADAAGLSLSAWIRSTLLRECKLVKVGIKAATKLYDSPVVLRDMSPEEMREQANSPRAFALGPRMPGVVTTDGAFIQTPEGVVKV